MEPNSLKPEEMQQMAGNADCKKREETERITQSRGEKGNRQKEKNAKK